MSNINSAHNTQIVIENTNESLHAEDYKSLTFKIKETESGEASLAINVPNAYGDKKWIKIGEGGGSTECEDLTDKQMENLLKIIHGDS